MTWVVMANTNSCNIYQWNKKDKELTLIKSLQDDEARQKNTEVNADRAGNFRTSAPGQGIYTQETDPKDVRIDKFAKEVADTLEHGRTKNLFSSLVMIMPAQMAGHLNKHSNGNLEKCISHHFPKNIMNLKEHEIKTFLIEHRC